MYVSFKMLGSSVPPVIIRQYCGGDLTVIKRGQLGEIIEVSADVGDKMIRLGYAAAIPEEESSEEMPPDPQKKRKRGRPAKRSQKRIEIEKEVGDVNPV